MGWTDLLANKTIQNHSTSVREIEDLREVVERDLGDAAMTGLSDDRRFATA